ncbi:cytochrome c oxidase assembly protein [Methylonatrum kenyense]|uniref:cytochrome c oxidase assembly protein n=1 Tax=Methylonatrum kenyense TaxID=455253 RepID=UPI0020BF06F4|nr:cytochrome c oxidase assembly protein [Methylonatrum kenyense]MCK8515656.1 cytochrome c oxidase assembly protein [Methylonatrum kenyense]
MLLAAAWAGPAAAHNPLTSSGQDQLAAILAAVMLAVVWLFYLRGLRARPAGAGPAGTFHFALLLCVLSLFGPLDDWAKTSTAAHMTQHMALMVVVAPIWVLSRPMPQLLLGSGRVLRRGWILLLRLGARPMLCAYLHAAAIWFWHTPQFYMLAVEDPWWHGVEHACFLLTALLFWWAVLAGAAKRAPWALLALLFTLMHTGFLGAVLTFADSPLYGEARSLADQQLAGLIMWVVGGIPYLVASAWVGWRWYRHLLRRMIGSGIQKGDLPGR